MDEYNRELEQIINIYKNEISRISNDYNKLNQFFIKIKQLISKKINQSANRDFLLSNSFFAKSALTQLLKFESYTPKDNGNLIVSSENCKFTISEVIMEGETTPEKIFIKLVDYNSQSVNHDIDLLIFDVINAIIFEKLLALPQYQKYRNFIPKYKGSFVSYTKNNWNYNELNYKNILSPYHYDNILSGNSPYYREKSLVFMTESINLISVLAVFLEYENDRRNTEKINRVVKVITKFADLYEFIKYFGYKYGFMHNDLHMVNVIYDISNDRLVLIDLGRGAFKKFITNVTPELNNSLMSEFIKLDCAELLKKANIKNYSDLFTNSDLYENTLSIESNGNYFGVIFDLMTYTMNVYMKTIYYFRKIYTLNQYNVITENLFKLIKVNYDALFPDELLHNFVTLSVPTTVEELIQNYLLLKQTFLPSFNDENIRKLLNCICEGSFYMGLYIHFLKLTTVDVRNNYYIFSGFHILRNNLADFHTYVLNVLTPFANQLRPFDSFISMFIPQPGGLSNIVNYKSILPSKTMSNIISNLTLSDTNSSKETTLTLNDTINLYKQYFNEKNTNIIPYNRKLDKFIKLKSVSAPKSAKTRLKQYKSI